MVKKEWQCTTCALLRQRHTLNPSLQAVDSFINIFRKLFTFYNSVLLSIATFVWLHRELSKIVSVSCFSSLKETSNESWSYEVTVCLIYHTTLEHASVIFTREFPVFGCVADSSCFCATTRGEFQVFCVWTCVFFDTPSRLINGNDGDEWCNQNSPLFICMFVPSHRRC